MEERNSAASAEERLRIVLAAGRMGTWEWDVETDVIRWSPEVEQLFGMEPGAFPPIFEAFLELVHPDDRGELQRHVGEALTDPSSRYDIEHRAEKNDGTALWLHCTGLVQRDSEGVAKRVVGTVADITDRKSLEAQLIQAQKMESVGQLAGGLAHDFNNLLTVVLGEAQAMRLAGGLAQPLVGCLADIEDAANRGQQLTRQLLAFARQQELQIASVETSGFLRDLTPMLQRLVGKRVKITLVAAEETGHVRADPSQLEQVIMNLVVNAKEAMHDKGHVSIRAENISAEDASDLTKGRSLGTRWVRISVADTGPGIEPEHANRLFEPFFTTKPEGTGLGLATCYGIVRQCGGRITAESAPGEGARFEILLPCDSTSVETSPAVQHPDRDPKSEHVLLVEDDDKVRRVAARALENAGFHVRAAANAEQAATIANDQPIDLIVTDVVMPGLDGVTMAHRLQERIDGVKVLFISGYRDKCAELTSEESQCFLPKPFTPTDLAEKAREILDRPGSRPVGASS